MSKTYVKDEKGKYRIVEKDRDQKEIIALGEQRPLSLEELDVRLKRVERVILDPRL